MRSKSIEMVLLFDCYGEMLTEKQRELFDLYYNEDFSLTELAEHAGISRQAAHDSIKRAEHSLTDMEQKLGLVKRFHIAKQCAHALRKCAQALKAHEDTPLTASEVHELTQKLYSWAAMVEQEERDGV